MSCQWFHADLNGCHWYIDEPERYFEGNPWTPWSGWSLRPSSSGVFRYTVIVVVCVSPNCWRLILLKFPGPSNAHSIQFFWTWSMDGKKDYAGKYVAPCKYVVMSYTYESPHIIVLKCHEKLQQNEWIDFNSLLAAEHSAGCRMFCKM